MTEHQDNNINQDKFLGKLLFEAELEVKTGLHIGGSSETLSIGGLDHPVIRDPITNYPYLPGSSIKGKLRSILERFFNRPLNRQGSRDTWRYESDDWEDGYTEIKTSTGKPPQYIKFKGAKKCEVSRLFGSTGSSCYLLDSDFQNSGLEKIGEVTIDGQKYIKTKGGRNYPARLIVRDAHLTEGSVVLLKNIDTGLYMTEWKFENGLDRITAAANPRQIERVPAGAKFGFEMVYSVENTSHTLEDIKNLVIALAILEDDAIGGHGSRGYGKIKFQDISLKYRPIEWYESQDVNIRSWSPKNIETMLKDFGSFASKMSLPSSGS